MSDIVDIIHRITYETNGGESLAKIEKLFQTITADIAKQTQSLERLQKALDGVTDPSKQAKIEKAQDNRRKKIEEQGKAINDVIINDKKLQQALQSEIGILNELSKRLELLRQARNKATSPSEIDKYSQQIKQVESEQRRLMSPNGSRLGGIGNSIMQGFGIGAGLAGFSAITQAVGWVKDFGVESAKAAANFNQLKVAFSTLLGSESAANKLLDGITNFASQTPFAVEQLVELSKQLIAFGFNADEIIPTLNDVGNIAAGVGTDKLPQIVLALGQIRSAGKLTGQDLLQLINAGFNPLQEIAQRTGVSYGKLKDEMEKGRITFDMVKESFRAATSEGGRFYNLMQRQTNTVAGQIDRLGDSVQQLKVAFGQSLQEPLKGVVSLFSSLVETVTEWISLSPEQEIMKEQEAFNSLIFALKNANDDESLRSSIISEITAKYPEFIRLVDLEKASNDQLSQAVGEVNRKYQERINLAALAARGDKLAARGTEIQTEYVDYLLKVGRALQRDRYIKDATQLATMTDEELDALMKRLPMSVQESINRFKELRAENQKQRLDNQRLIAAEQAAQKKADEEALKAAKEKLKLLKEQGAAQADIEAQERFIAGLEYVAPTPTASVPYTAPKAGRKRDPYVVAKEQVKEANELARLNDAVLQAYNNQAQQAKVKYSEWLGSVEAQTASSDLLKLKEKQLNDDLNIINLFRKQRINMLDREDLLRELAAAEKFKKGADIAKIKGDIEESLNKELDLRIEVRLAIRKLILDQENSNFQIDELTKNEIQKSVEEAQKEADRIIANFNKNERKKKKLIGNDEELNNDPNRQLFAGGLRQDILDTINLYEILSETAINTYNQIANAKQDQVNREIEYQQYAIQQAQILAERGNTEALRIEEERLRELQQQQREYARQQQIINSALALSYSIAAIAKAALEGGGYASLATVAAVIAALGTGYAFVQSFSANAQSGFAEGGYTGDGGKYEPAGTVHKGEFVFTKEATKRIGVPTLEKLMKGDLSLNYSPILPKSLPNDSIATSKEIKSLKKELAGIKQAIYDTEVKAENRMDGRGVTQLIEKHIKQDKRRFK